MGSANDDCLVEGQTDDGSMAVGTGLFHNNAGSAAHIGQEIIVGVRCYENIAGLEFFCGLGGGAADAYIALGVLLADAHA